MATRARQEKLALRWDGLLDRLCTAQHEYEKLQGLDLRDEDDRDEPLQPLEAVEPHELEAAAAALVDAARAVGAYGRERHAGYDLRRDERAAEADRLRREAKISGHAFFAEVADLIAPSDTTGKACDGFAAAYHVYAPLQALQGVTPSADARVALRLSVEQVLASEPRSAEELGRVVWVGCAVGVNALVRRASPAPDAYAANLYRHFFEKLAPLPAWFLANHVGFRGTFHEVEYTPRPGDFVAEPGLIDELLDAAGRAWRQRIASHVERLNGELDPAE
jgi:hypothetical protein